jgi:hypothetical protein
MGVGLVCDDAVRSRSGPSTGPSGRHADVVDQRQELRVVAGLTRRDPNREGASAAVDTEVGLGAPPTPGSTQRVIGGLRPQNLVIPPSPLGNACVLRRHAGAPSPRWSRPRPPTPGRRRHAPDLEAQPAHGPRSRPWPTGRTATRPSARKGNSSAGPATATRSETANKSPRPPVGDHSSIHLAAAYDPAATAQSWPTSRQSTSKFASRTPPSP